jgi:hypothetical protein
MADETQRRDYEQLPADGDVVEQADAHPRHHAILAAYAGLERRELAFGLALILDEIAATFPTSTTNSQAVACSGKAHEPCPVQFRGLWLPVGTPLGAAAAVARPSRTLGGITHE